MHILRSENSGFINSWRALYTCKQNPSLFSEFESGGTVPFIIIRPGPIDVAQHICTFLNCLVDGINMYLLKTFEGNSSQLIEPRTALALKKERSFIISWSPSSVITIDFFQGFSTVRGLRYKKARDTKSQLKLPSYVHHSLNSLKQRVH